MEAGDSKQDIVSALQLLIGGGARQYIPGNATLVDHLECPLAVATPVRNRTGYELYRSCVRGRRQCHRPEFLDARREAIGKVIADALPKLREGYSEEVGRVLNMVLTDPEKARGKSSCWRIGDVIIALEQPEDATLLTLDRNFVPICEALERQVSTFHTGLPYKQLQAR